MIRKLAIVAGALALVAAGILLTHAFDRNLGSRPGPEPVSTAVTALESRPRAPVVSDRASDSAAPVAKAGVDAERAERLKALEAKAIEALPTTAEIRKKSNEEVHATPPEILDAGRRLGELAEYLARNPDLVPSALPTYVRCAKDASVVTAIRALCAFRLHVYEKAWDETTRVSFANLPPDVRAIAKQLEGTE